MATTHYQIIFQTADGFEQQDIVEMESGMHTVLRPLRYPKPFSRYGEPGYLEPFKFRIYHYHHYDYKRSLPVFVESEN